MILKKGKDALVGFSIFVLGLIFGSFLNMLIYRLPLEISLIDPKRSFCTSCKYQIKWYENIPLLSYIFLKGHCSSCKEKISIIYPIIELITAATTILLFYKLGFTVDFITTTLLFYTLITLSFIDFKYKAVPDYLLILALLFAFSTSKIEFSTALIFAGGLTLLELIVTFYIQKIKSRITNDNSLKDQRSIGDGDIPIVAIIGGLLGLKLGLIAIFLGTLFAIIPSILNNIIKKDIETPFIPFLSLGLFVVFIFDIQIIDILNSILLEN